MTYEEYREICNLIDKNTRQDISIKTYRRVEVINREYLKNQIKIMYERGLRK